ncbi:MAG: methyltransferase domain-containing protein, partial [Gimesia sp.]|nr:methyltransferase domain-containing protein [Gimesia sp.]
MLHSNALGGLETYNRNQELDMAHAEDRWDGSEYAQNASMQYRQALEALERIDVGSFGRVIDIGCGNGEITKYLSDQMPDGQVVGVDVSPS